MEPSNGTSKGLPLSHRIQNILFKFISLQDTGEGYFAITGIQSAANALEDLVGAEIQGAINEL